MKKFIDELNEHRNYLLDLPGKQTEAQRKFAEMRKQYNGFIGRRALYKSGRAESRVVQIVEVTSSYVRMEYAYYGMNYQGKMSTCASFNSLLCGDDRVEIE